MANTIDIAQQGIALSIQLLALADNEKWDEFFELEAERHALLLKVSVETDKLTETELQQLRVAMDQLLEFNDKLEKICRLERQNAGVELQKLQKNSKVSKAYSE